MEWKEPMELSEWALAPCTGALGGEGALLQSQGPPLEQDSSPWLGRQRWLLSLIAEKTSHGLKSGKNINFY